MGKGRSIRHLFFSCLFLLLVGSINSCSTGPNLRPVDESYKPEQPIEFPHDIHAGKNGIDCKYCHNSEFDENNTGIPTTKVCLKCHRQINGKIVSDSIQK
jgi:hypothetical protein